MASLAWGKAVAGGKRLCSSRRTRLAISTPTTPRRSLSIIADDGQDRIDAVTIPSSANGEITIEVRNGHLSSDIPVIIYIPGHPSFSSPSSQRIPREFCHWPVARINYRWSATNRFPSPLHDTLTGWDWLLDNLFPAPTRDGLSPVEALTPRRRAFVYGSDIGGSLATSLALTESRPRTSLAELAGVAVEDTIFDWASLVLPFIGEEAAAAAEEKAAEAAEAARKPDVKLKSRPGSTTRLKAKKQGEAGSSVADLTRDIDSDKFIFNLAKGLFKSPAQCFDPFASPYYFFRTSGREIPSNWDGEPEVESDGILLPGSAPTRQQAMGLVDETEVLEEAAQSPVPRRAHLKFPPRNSGIRLPNVRISTSPGAPVLVEQAEEMVRLLRRSYVKYDLEGDEDFERPRFQKADADPDLLDMMSADAQNRIQHFMREEDELERIADWFNETT